MKIPDKVYDILKWIALICIPAIVTFLSVVLGVLEVDPKTINIVVTIIAAIGTLIGSLIGVSTAAYNKDKDKGGDAKSQKHQRIMLKAIIRKSRKKEQSMFGV